jgi:hypothetical protein
MSANGLATLRSVEGPALKPTSAARADATSPRPSLELWIAFAASVVPHAVALFAGGYGQMITNAPLAVVVTVVDAVAMVIAYLQYREDSQTGRSSHRLVWTTIAVGGLWLVYALFVGAVILLGKALCISETCRGLIR